MMSGVMIVSIGMRNDTYQVFLATAGAKRYMLLFSSLLRHFHRTYFQDHDDKPIFIGGLHFQLNNLLFVLTSIVDPLLTKSYDFSFINLVELQDNLIFMVRYAVSEECNGVLSKGLC